MNRTTSIPILALMFAMICAFLSRDALAASPMGGDMSSDMDLTADDIQFDISEGQFQKLQAIGGAEMVSGGLTIKSDVLNYLPQQNQLLCRATGPRRVKVSGDVSAECNELQYFLAEGDIILRGDAWFTRGGITTHGEEIKIGQKDDGTWTMISISEKQLTGKGNNRISISSGVDDSASQAIQDSFGVNALEARKLIDGHEPTSAVLEVGKEKGGGSSASARPKSGKIDKNNLDRIPDKSGTENEKKFAIEP